MIVLLYVHEVGLALEYVGKDLLQIDLLLHVFEQNNISCVAATNNNMALAGAPDILFFHPDIASTTTTTTTLTTSYI